MMDKVTIHDLRKSGFCISGIKSYYEKLGLKLTFKEFVREGIDLDIVREIDDAYVQRGIKNMKKRIMIKKSLINE